MNTYIVTGASSGLGLEITRQLSREAENRVIMAVRNVKKTRAIAKKIRGNIEVMELDLSKIGNIPIFCKAINFPVAALINNAGVQNTKQISKSQDGFEETLAVNYLAAYSLTRELLKTTSIGKVVFIGSGTHNPKHPLAGMFGFQGAQIKPLKQLLKTEAAGDDYEQFNKDQYASSKLLTTVATVEFAKRYPSVCFYTLDPGLMAGTGLARNQSALLLFLWKRLLPVMSFFMPDCSNVKKSAKTAQWLLSDSCHHPSGAIVSFNRKPSRYLWTEKIHDESLAYKYFEETNSILNKFTINSFNTKSI